MSTSDAVHSELTVRRETATPPHGEAHEARISTARQWDGYETPHLEHPSRRAVTHERTANAPTVDRGTRYITCIVLTLPNNLDLDKSEISLKRKQESCAYSSNEPLRYKTVGSNSQVNRPTSLPETSRATSKSPLPQKIPYLAEKDKDILAVGFNGCKSKSGLPCGLQPRATVCGSTGFEHIKDCAKLEKQTDVEELPDPSEVMLSSAMVTVLAPSYSGRLRRSKRFDTTGSLETLPHFAGVANSEAASRPQDYSQRFNMSQAQSRTPFLSTRQNTTGWSTKCVPQNLDYELERKGNRTLSLDGSSKATEIKKAQASTTWDQYVQKMTPQDGHPVRRSSLSSKPTTSSLLLSLRRINSQSMNSNNPAPSEVVKPMPLKSGQDAKLFSTQVTQPFRKTLERERFKPLRSSLTVSPMAPEPQPVSSPSLTNDSKRGTSKTSLFFSSPINKITTDTPKQLQTMNRAQPRLSSSTQTFLSQPPTDNENNRIGSGRGLSLFSDSSGPSHKHIQYDAGVPSERGAPSRNTPGSSSGRWQQNSQKGGSPTPVLTDTPNIINKPNTPLIPLFNNNCDTAALSLTNNKSLNCQISNSSSNRGTTEPVCNGSINPVMKRGTGRVIENHSDYLLGRVGFAKQLYESSLKKLEAQKSPSLPDARPLSQPNNSMKRDVSNVSIKANPESPASPDNKYRNDQSSLMTNNTHQTTTNKQCPPLHSTNTLKNQAAPSKNVSGFSPNPTASPSFQSKPDSFRSNVNTSSVIGSTSQPKVPDIATTNALLDFIERYDATSKPFQPKDVSRHVPTVNASPATPTKVTSANTLTITSPLQTPSATTISPTRKAGGILTHQSEKDNKKSASVHGKRVKHVMWEDSENFEPTKSPEPSVPTSPLSRSRSQRLIRAPSIFSFLRSSSQNTKNTPLCTTPRKTNLQVGKGEKYRSLSSDSVDPTSREGGERKQSSSNAMSCDQERREPTPCRLQRSRSLQADEFLYQTSARSPPPDFSNGYKIRYSPPPYTTLISSRGETKKATPRTSLFPNLNSNSKYTSNHPLHSHSVADATSLSLRNPPKPSSPLQNKTLSHENLLYGVSQTNEINNNNYKSTCRNQQTGRLLLIESRVDVIPQSLQSLKMDVTASTPKNANPESQLFTKTLPSVEAKPSEQSHRTLSHSNQSSSDSSSTESRSVGDDVGNKRMKESVMAKFKLFSADSNNEQSPKRRRFVGKKSVSVPNSENEKANKTSNKMDQVINKLRQTFSTKRPDDELQPRKSRPASETPSVSGVSDASDATVEGNRIAEPKDDKRAKHGEEWAQNRYSLIPTLSVQNSMTENEFFIWPDKSSPKEQNKIHFGPQKLSDPTDVKNRSTNCLLSVDPSPSRSPKLAGGQCTKFGKSTSSSKSPFSPFSSFSPHSPFSSPDVADDNVFYSPKIQRRRETSSPCEPVEGISLVGPRRSRASTGPPSTGPIQDEASCYADLKYGIEPGRSVSVSSVLSSRPSRPGRISTGPRFMSVDDLSESDPTYGRADEDFNQWLERNCNHRPISQMQSDFPSDGGKMRSRSLPRSLTRRLAQWSSGVSVCPPADATASMSPHLWNPKRNTCHFDWETVSPPTPPPTPPLSPQARRMSKPLSPNVPSPTGEPVDSQSPRLHLPTRGYVSNLSAFEESTDSSSDTTTDDEYYLEKSDDEEKETEL
ncbi:uncharacterized protein LOC144040531 [Vanacampus margaritifer]